MTSQSTELNRRTFLHTSLGAGAAMGTILAANMAAAQQSDSRVQAKSTMKEGAVILCQGDSITDAGRDRKVQDPNHPKALGDGYPLLIASELLLNPAKPKIFNRGISGNKVPDLQARWQQDCIDLKPDVLSILIGVNDIWHKLNGKYTGTVEDYETGYRKLLKETQDKLPQARIIVCEPFVLRVGAVSDK